MRLHRSTYHYSYCKIADMMKPGLVMSIAWLFLLTGAMWIVVQVGVFEAGEGETG